MIARKTTLAFVTGFILANGAWAADGNDGTSTGLGETSTGTLTIDMKVPDFRKGSDGGSVLIQNLDNINLGTFGPDNNLQDGSNFCIYGTGVGAGNDFSIDLKIEGDATNGFVLAGGDQNNTSTIAYDVYYSGGLNVNDSNGDQATSGESDHTFDLTALGLDESFNCVAASQDGTPENASLYIVVDQAQASRAPADNYKGTLTLLAEAK
ncbi:hypothetical protein GZ77_18880 [Endozoicomonas montiporae]|uniref:DUF4402 domain-containing protein n=2 Tax=Endozoicomonas montiporae TaxID=1027273 RepID=A0A081N2A1_9GAMM|nr:hypothetical protein [Endozoicomonas montiporae]AMO58466.1 hypothetical protein EZMO1_4554 [Endozoicomonas montiporae CL-33]KEQ12574.1 hypothetical protein GZ77_18880 [Endozoicomonas montiporae]